MVTAEGRRYVLHREGKKVVGDKALSVDSTSTLPRSTRHNLLQPQSQALGLPSAASSFPEMLPRSSWP